MSGSNTPTVLNQTLTNANTEYSIVIPAGARGFEFQCRTSADVRYAFVTGKVATPTAPYMTLKSGAAYNSNFVQDEPTTSEITLYVASASAGVVVELTHWK